MKTKLIFQVFSIIFLILSTQTFSQTFTETANLTGTIYGNAVWGDYDNDGDLDAFIVGSSTSRLYRNDAGSFVYVSTGITGVQYGSCAWGDYDNDGDLDIAITGNAGTKFSKIYRNDGSNVFTDIGAGLIGVDWSTIAWGDYDNDGKLDLLVSGLATGEEPVARLYHNDGNDVFTNSQIAITPCVRGVVKWGDYNNDDLLDILMLGQDFDGNANTEIYKNDGNGHFISINANMADGFRGGVDWGDYDNDGDLDVLIGGQMCGTRIYRNDGNGVFTFINAGLPALSYCPVAWGDYDNDGDLDIILAGVNVYNGTSYTQLFQNKGNNVFTEDSNVLTDLSEGSVTFGDYNGDGKTDLIITGRAAGNISTSKIYRNDTPNSNAAPTAPGSLQSTVINNGAVLKWNLSTDSPTPSAGLTYNVRIGTTTNGINILSPMANVSTGYRRTSLLGNAMQDDNYVIKNLPVGTYYWSVQAVDPSGKASLFPSASSFTILPTVTDMNVNMLSVENSAMAWGDYDNDGNLDLLLLGYNSASGKRVSKIYRNNGSAVFDTINANLKGVEYGSGAWGDYDNDGDLDLLIAGNSGPFSIPDPVSKIYRNNGNNTFTDINAGLTGVGGSSCDWGDYDNDGDLDILLSGNGLSTIYRNDGNGIFVDINTNFVQSYQGSASWGDFDKDMDLDVLIYGSSKTEIYKNNGSDNFVSLGVNIPGGSEGSAAWGDYDNDGYLDILVTGSVINYNVAKIYRNNGSGVFTDIGAGLRGVSESKGIWGDFNNDGWSDIVYTGRSGDFITKILLNNNGTFSDTYAPLTGDYRSKLSTADYDNDGDLDIIITRYSSQKPILYRNNMNFPNDPPEAPTNLLAENTGMGVTLSWDVAADNQSVAGGLSYNLRLGLNQSGYELISPMVTTPGNNRLIPAIGNAQMNTSWRIDSLPVGTYYWSVQAIDQSYKGGAWATEQSFVVSQLRPFFTFDTACFGALTYFIDQTITTGTQIASWSWDFGDGKSSSLRNPSHLFASAGTYSVTLEVTDTAGVRLSKTNSVLVLPRPVADFSVANICIGSMASVVNASITDTLAISSWLWDFDDGTTSSLQYPGPHGYLATGTYDIALSVYAKNGCSGTKVKPITVAEYPAAIISASGSMDFCEGGNVKLIVPYSSSYTYQWKNGGTLINGADSSVFVATYSGSYSASVTNTIAGCLSETIIPATVNVAVSPERPLITADSDTIFCQGDSVTLSVTNTDGYTYQWKLNGGAVGSNSNQLVAKISGNYTVVVLNSSGCSATSYNSKSVIVNPKPVVGSISQSGDTRFCKGSSVTLSIPAATGYSYSWKNGSITVPGAVSNSLTVFDPGNYTVEVSTTSGCRVSTDFVKVEVNPMPLRPSIDKGSYTEGTCLGTSPIKLSVEDVIEGYSYRWFKNGAPVSTSSFIEGFLDYGSYYVEADLAGCKNHSDSIKVNSESAPDKPVLSAKGPTIWYLSSSIANAVEYKWYFNGQFVPDANASTYVAYQNLGVYRVGISYDRQCFSFSDTLRIPTGITGIEDIDPFENVKIYPNPTTGLFTIEMNNNVFGELIIDIFTQNGSKILNIKFQKTTEYFRSQIDLSVQSSGMYILNLGLDKFRAVRKILVE